MKVFFLSILLFCLGGTLIAQKLSPEQIKSLDQIVADNVDDGAPGLAMGIIKNGKVVYQKYAGVSNLDPVTQIDENTRFNIASLAKQFTAMCILRLVEDEKLKLDDDIRQFIPQLYPDIKSPITIAHLLNHSSGIRDMNSLWSLQNITWWKNTFSNQDAIDLLAQQQDLNFEPGSRHVYSNSNFILLAEVVKVVSGQSFKEYSDQMFAEIGMKDTRFEPQHDQIENMARPYFNFDTWKTYDWLSDLHGDGALFTTLEDQLRWEKMLQKRKSKVLGREYLEMSQNLIAGSEIDNYGFGLSFGEYQGLPYKYHEGATGAWHATTLRFESEKLSIFITSNSGRVSTSYWSRRCADILIDADKFTSVGITLSPEETGDPLPTEKLLGTYKTSGGYYIQILESDGKWLMRRMGRNDIELEKEDDNLWHEVTDPSFKQWFSLDDENNYQITLYHTSHPPYSLQKVKGDFSEIDFAAADGSYRNAETGGELKIKYLEDDRYEVNFRGRDRKALMLEPDKLILSSYILDLERDTNGQVDTVLLYSSRLKAVRYELE